MMHRRRRLVGLALAVPLVLGGVAACQASPGAAAQVGDTRISEEQVDRVVSDLHATLEPRVGPGEEEQRQFAGQLAEVRNHVMTMLVLTEAGEQYAAAHDLELPPASVAIVSQQLGFPEDHAYVAVRAEFDSVMAGLRQSLAPVEPSEADQREVYENLEFQGQRVTVPFEQVRGALTVETMGRAVAERDLLAAVVAQADVRVQPGYELVHQVVVPLGGPTSWLGVRISEPSQVLDAG